MEIFNMSLNITIKFMQFPVLSHLTSHHSGLHEIRKFDDKFVKITIFRTEKSRISANN